jgi:integrase
MGRNTLPWSLRIRPDTGYYVYKLAGWKDYKTTGTKLKGEAMTVVMQALKEAEQKAEGRMTLRVYADPFYIYDRCPHIQRIGRRITKKSARIMRAYLENHLFTDPLASKVMSDITIRDITDYRARLEKKAVAKQEKKPKERKDGDPEPEPKIESSAKPLAAETINKIMAGVKVIFREACLNRDLLYNPCSGIVRLDPEENPRGVYTREELLVLFKNENWTNKEALFCFLFDAMTGMRCGEVLAFPWGCFFPDFTLDIVNAWKDTAEPGEPKWDKPRAIPASESAKKLLELYKPTRKMTAAKDLLFCEEEKEKKKGARRGATWWKKNFEGPMLKSKLPALDIDGHKRTPHSLRHSLNTILLQAGCNPLLVREYLGWSEDGPRVTRVQKGYTHFNVTDMKGVLEVIDGLFLPLVEEGL